jgi:hypothetical protein
VSETRDLRIDFFRGLALWMIFTDHIPGNVARYFTYHALGFSTAAEVFVFLSGISSALLYGRLIATAGFRAAQHRALRRVCQIYLAYVAVVAVTIAISHAAHYVLEDGFEAMIAAPGETLLAALALVYSPGVLSILPLYLPLVAAAPLLVMALDRRPAITLALSVLLWLVVEIWGWNFPARPPLNGWGDDPLSWQLVFVLGLLAGRRYYGEERHFSSARWLRQLCWIVVAANAAASLAAHGDLVFGHIPAAANAVKAYLSAVRGRPTEHWLRLVHFLAVAYLVASYVPSKAPFLRQGWSRVIQLSGRFSLEVFSLGIVLTLIAAIYLERQSHSLPAQALINGLGWMLMTGFAFWLSHQTRRSRLSRSARPEAS